MAKISKAGIYDLDMNTYHGDCCVGPSISSSGIRQLLNCPAKYWANSPLNPDRVDEKETEAFNFGTAAHELLLEGIEPEDKFHVLPKGFNASHEKWAAEDAKKEAALKQGKTIVRATTFDIDIIKAMMKAIKDHPYAWAYFKRGEPEKSLIWQDEITGVWIKSRPDFIPSAGRIIPDYKTAVNADLDSFSRDLSKYGYHVQAQLVLTGIEKLTDLKPEAFGFVVQEKTAPYIVQSYNLDGYALEQAKLIIRQGLNLFAKCLETNTWPGYDWRNTDVIPNAELPRWHYIQMEEQIERGDFEIEQEQVYGSRQKSNDNEPSSLLDAG